MRLSHTAFRGELPIVDARLLPEQNAQVARNVYLRHGTLKPEQGVAPVSGVTTAANPTTLYRYPHGNDGDGYWLSWSDTVHVVPSPLADDDWERVYWTGQGAPKMAPVSTLTSGSPPYPGAWYALGVPAPASAPTVSAPSDRVDEGEYPDMTLETAYAVTFVSRYGEEGPPSDPSTSIERWDMVDDAPDGGEVEVSLPDAPSGNHDLTVKRLYRVESGGVFQYVTDLDISASTYTDEVLSERLGDAMVSMDWDGPDDRLRGLTALPNGILAGFWENTLAFCEAYQPHAWPVGYRLAMPDHIVAIASIGAGLVVVTEGKPQLVTGSSPAAMNPLEMDETLPCVAARSLVDMGDYALYASGEGLVAVGGRDARVISRDVLSKDQWKTLKPETIHAYRWEGRYLAFYEGGSFVFTPGEGIEFLDVEADGGYYDIGNDTLYLLQDGDLVAWRQGEPLTFVWRSRLHEVPPGAGSFSCAKVIAAGYPVTLRLIADGETVIEKAVEDGRLFRLPAGFVLARDWEIELSGDQEVKSVQVATSPGELV